MKRNSQQGFTIIELVVVILLLGILTATALPRFMNVTDEAHGAVVEGVVSGMSTGAALYRAQWYATGQTDTAIAEFGSLRPFTQVGYPLGTNATATVLTSMTDSSDCVAIFTNLLQPAGLPSIRAITAGAAPLAATDITTSSVDFLAYLDTTSSVTKRQCVYAYTGQFTDASAFDVPLMTYSAADGTVVIASTPL